jgi:hypothetical protein
LAIVKRIDAALEVAVAAQHAAATRLVLLDRVADRRRRGPLLPMQVVHP